ncbi:MAG: TIGR04283 family arsenosugar biosynthesis glycosyltransferase [Rhodospirillales bacterium]|nr:TIGR04283 family arsenosugar biosynthesis glycosyltransferase [Rhodospirillales bacterium]
MLAVVIPTLNAAATLGRTLEAVAAGGDAAVEVVVADGGSADSTCRIAVEGGARVVVASRGRGRQLAAGARVAVGAWLLFLHADTRLPRGWRAVVATFAESPENVGRAGYFRFALDDDAAAARRLEAAVAWRCRRLGLPYGDQGLLIARRFYEGLGGYQPMPLMEDVDLVRRIGKRRLVELGATAVTSAERYRRDGYGRRAARNAMCLGLYTAGVPPHLIARFYG